MKILALAIGIIFILGIPSFAQNITLTQPGMLPDNPFHGFQDFFENLQLFFAFNPQDKANVHLQFAEKRLAELNLAIQENKTDLIHSLSQDYDNEINQTQSEVDNAKGLGQNVTALAQHVAEETFKHQLVLERVLGQVPDVAKSTIEHAINVSTNGHDQAVESIFESRNITGTVNVTFTIDNQTFTQTFNITSVHGKPHIERQQTENETISTETETQTTTETELPENAALSAKCEIYGGTITNSQCCKTATDFPNNCLIGACGCSLDNSHKVKVCQCPEGECWNGNRCVSTNASTSSMTISTSTITLSSTSSMTSSTTTTTIETSTSSTVTTITSPCTEGERKCIGNSIGECMNGNWTIQTNFCLYGCADGKCNVSLTTSTTQQQNQNITNSSQS